MGCEKYDLYVVKSNLGILEILNILKTHSLNDNNIGPIRKEFSRSDDGKYFEIDERLVVLKKDFFTYIKSLKVFDIKPFRIEKRHYASPGKACMFLFYQLSRQVDCNSLIVSKLSDFVTLGMIQGGDYHIHSLYSKFGICEFSANVDKKTRTIIKIMTDYPEDFRVSWCRVDLLEKFETVL